MSAQADTFVTWAYGTGTSDNKEQPMRYVFSGELVVRGSVVVIMVAFPTIVCMAHF